MDQSVYSGRVSVALVFLYTFHGASQEHVDLTARAPANSVALAGHLALELSTQLGRALPRFSRLLRHPRRDDQSLTA